MIKSYGLHWHLDRVTWGKQGYGNSGKLLGAASRSAKAHPIDFRNQRGIYALYADYDLIYIGQTGAQTNDRLFARLRFHRKDHLSERWNRFSWFGTQRVNSTSNALSVDTASVSQSVEAALNIMEAVAIAIAEPKLNLQRGRWSEAKPYYQYWKDEGALEVDADDDE